MFSRVPLALWYPVARFLALLRLARDSLSPPRGRSQSQSPFPEWDDATRERVIRDYYRGFADMLVEVMHSLAPHARRARAARDAQEPRSSCARRSRAANPCCSGRAPGNWEWMLLGLSTQLGVPVDAAYKPLVDSWAEVRDAQAARRVRRAHDPGAGVVRRHHQAARRAARHRDGRRPGAGDRASASTGSGS